MLDRRDFDEWWAREDARSGATNGFVAKHWAEAGFMAARDLMAQSIRTQKHIERQPARLLQGARDDR